MPEITPAEARAVFRYAPDGILIVDGEGRILRANRQIAEQFGYAADELVGEKVELLVPERVRDLHRDERAAYVDEPRTRPMGVGLELFGRQADGTEFPVEISLSPFRTSDGELRVIASVRDVTERRRLREFGAGSLRATEEERRRIARELHDDTAQRLAAIILRLRLAARADEPERRAELLEEIREETLAAAESVRRIARGLRPPALEELGLVAAIRSHVRSLAAGSGGPDFRIEAEGVDVELEEERKLALYRIVQEALSNALRHAQPETVEVRVEYAGGLVRAVVKDDGRGFDLSTVRKERTGRLGLIGMEERAGLVGGRVEVESEPGRGTRVTAELPTGGRAEVHVGEATPAETETTGAGPAASNT